MGNLQFNPLAIWTALAYLISSWLAIVTFRRRKIAGGLQLSLLMAATATWSFFYTLELLSRHPAAQIIFGKLEYFGIVLVSPAWYLFGRAYGKSSQLHRLPRALHILFWAIPVTTLFLTLTNEQHHLIWQEYTTYRYGDLLIARPQYGPFFWIHAFYSYLLLLGGTIHILKYARSTFARNRQHAILLSIGLIPAWLVNSIYLLGYEPIAGFDLTIFGLITSGSLLTWGLYRHNLLDIIPVAAETILETIEDGILVFRYSDHALLHVNSSIFRLLSIPKNTPLLGKRLEDALPDVHNLLANPDIEHINGHWLQARMRFVQNSSEIVLVYLQDVTPLVVTQQELKKRNRLLAAINRLTHTILTETNRQSILDELAIQSRDILQVDQTILLDADANSTFILSSTLPEDTAQKVLQFLPATVFHAEKIETVTQATGLLQTLLVVPLLVEKRRIGTLILGCQAQRTFTPQDKDNALQVANQIALGVSKLWLLEELQKQAIQDGLTQAYNHRFLNLTGQKLFHETRQNGQPFSVIFFDLDDFKSINDQYGHLIGDMVLRQIARRAKRILRAHHFLIRYGGDEFAVLLPDTSQAKAEQIAKELRQSLQQEPIPTPKGDILPRISIGIAASTPTTISLESLLRNADHALYKSKTTGKNTTTIYESDANLPSSIVC